MEYNFVVRVVWNSGAESVWIETVSGLSTPVSAMQYIQNHVARAYPFTTGKVSVEYVTEEEAHKILIKPLYEPTGKRVVGKI